MEEGRARPRRAVRTGGGPAAPLRRSLSFRHWSRPEAPRVGPWAAEALAAAREPGPGPRAGREVADPEAALEPAAPEQPASRSATPWTWVKCSARTTRSDLSAAAAKQNCTLDNSDLQRLERARRRRRPRATARRRSTGCCASSAASSRRKDGAPGGGPSPRSGASRSRGYFQQPAAGPGRRALVQCGEHRRVPPQRAARPGEGRAWSGVGAPQAACLVEHAGAWSGGSGTDPPGSLMAGGRAGVDSGTGWVWKFCPYSRPRVLVPSGLSLRPSEPVWWTSPCPAVSFSMAQPLSSISLGLHWARCCL